ncbi:GNAT family N-acetyltransferase [Streptomyces candidus]|uniref:Ribosomal protein S18 acetylase RimI-like enzyme n=1 Tax=Streptomyces candidus TaxID=67283 RepID=A0A7X0HIB7_9ACTN|nr:GNAT family N-acetyltransferase [Streptomyces candidus]MBB6438204.1 ribosomal protein S18 acetylase RimI-like enzyme [Streptomyces candidus]GHH38929.1 hypothetical protein GCM10018773_17910 [Streptomyces candidus]
MSTVVVRRRRDADLVACVRMLRAVHEASGYPRDWPAEPAGWLVSNDSLGEWVAESADGELVGHVALTAADPARGDVAPGLWDGAGQPLAVVARLFVSPHDRGGGAGRALMRQVGRAAEESGRQAVLDVVAADTGAVAFYERIGCRLLGSGEQDWGGGEVVGVRCYAVPAPSATPDGAATRTAAAPRTEAPSGTAPLPRTAVPSPTTASNEESS